MNQQVWNYLNDEQRTNLIVKCKWITHAGTLNPTGRRIYRSSWIDLSECAKNIIIKHFNQEVA